MSIRIPIITDYDGKGLEKAVKEFESLKTAGQKAQFAIKKAAVPAALAVAGLGAALVDCTKGAMEDEAAQAELARTLSISTSATDAQVKATEDFISKMSLASGTADDELRPALASLARGTKDLKQAQEGLTLAQDIATATGKPLGDVADALSKAYAGNYKGLKALSPEMAGLIKDGADLNTIMDVLGGTFGGATATAAGTAEGQMKRFGIAISEAKENIGAALIPVLEKALPALTAFGEWAQKNTKLFLAIGGVIGGIAVAVLAVNAALKVYNAIQTITNALTAIWNALLLANPVTLIILGIVALIAVMTALYFKFDSVREIVDTVFQGMVTGAKFVLNGIKSYFDGVYSVFKTVFNGIASLWNNTVGKLSFSIPSWVPGLGGKGFSVPQIPMLAEGGIVDSPTLALIGESGPEAVVPLGRGGGMGNVTVNVNGGFSTSAEIGQAVVNALRAFNRQQGAASFSVTGYA